MKKIIAVLLIFALVGTPLASCGTLFVTDEQKASHDCDFAKVAAVKQAACDYVEALKGDKAISDLILEKDEEIKVLENEKKDLQDELEVNQVLTKELKELWENSKETPKKAPPTATPTRGGIN